MDRPEQPEAFWKLPERVPRAPGYAKRARSAGIARVTIEFESVQFSLFCSCRSAGSSYRASQTRGASELRRTLRAPRRSAALRGAPRRSAYSAALRGAPRRSAALRVLRGAARGPHTPRSLRHSTVVRVLRVVAAAPRAPRRSWASRDAPSLHRSSVEIHVLNRDPRDPGHTSHSKASGRAPRNPCMLHRLHSAPHPPGTPLSPGHSWALLHAPGVLYALHSLIVIRILHRTPRPAPPQHSNSLREEILLRFAHSIPGSCRFRGPPDPQMNTHLLERGGRSAPERVRAT
eukprot:gene17606-biopygen855